MNKIKKYIKNPKLVVLYLMNKGHFKFLSDDLYLRIEYRLIFGKKLNLDNPKTFNEKLQWLKIHDRKDIYTTMVDKYDAKKYISDLIGDKYIVPTIGIFSSFDEIDFTKLPNQFVIKCTHDSGGLVIVKDKSQLNIKGAKRKINKSLKKNYFYASREWPYKNVRPRIIIEKYIQDNESNTMRDYKFFCFNGTPKMMYLSEGLENHATASMSFYDMDFKLLDCKRKDYKNLSYTPKKPKTFEKMKKFAAILSENVPHLRVDFYEVNGALYFGELTFFTCSGFMPFEEAKWDEILGKYIDLSKVE